MLPQTIATMRHDFEWQRALRPRRRTRRPGTSLVPLFVLTAAAGWVAAGWYEGQVSHPLSALLPSGGGGASNSGEARAFGACFTGGGTNCVVDGDTFWMDGAKIRIADIDAPETHPPRCSEESALGDRATDRLQELLNAGPVTLVPIDRDEDIYGRKLRIVERDGQSIGETLVGEGLARRWIGHRMPWCGTI